MLRDLLAFIGKGRSKTAPAPLRADGKPSSDAAVPAPVPAPEREPEPVALSPAPAADSQNKPAPARSVCNKQEKKLPSVESAKVRVLKRESERLLGERNDALQEIRRLKMDNRSLIRRLESLRKREPYEERVKELQDKCVSLEASERRIREKCMSLEESERQVREKCVSLEVSERRFREDFRRAQETLYDERRHNSAAQTMLWGRINSLETQLADSRDLLKDLRRKNERLSKMLVQDGSDWKRAAQRFHELDCAVEQLTAQIDALKSENKRLGYERDIAKMDADEAIESIESVRRERDALLVQTASLNRRIKQNEAREAFSKSELLLLEKNEKKHPFRSERNVVWDTWLASESGDECFDTEAIREVERVLD